MDKKIAVGIIVVIVLVIAGIFFLNKSQKPKPPLAHPFTTIEDAFSKSLSLECNYTDKTGKKIIGHIKNGQIQTAIPLPNSGFLDIIVKDKKIYLWQEGKTEGVIMNADSKNAGSTNDVRDGVLANLEKIKKNCEQKNVSDDLFNPPQNVTFKNLP